MIVPQAKTRKPMSRFSQHLLTFAKVLASQAIVFAGFLLFYKLGGRLPLGVPMLLLMQGALAAIIGRLLGLWSFWMPIQLILPLAIVYNEIVPGWAYAAAFIASALVFWNGTAEQVPFYMSNRRTFAALSGLLEETKATRAVDLGSGLSGVVTFLARRHSLSLIDGVETAPLLVATSKLRVFFSRLANARILYRSLWDVDLAGYDLVYCFLSPVPMPRLYEKAKAEMRPGTLLVSNSFAVPGVAPERVISVDDGRRTQLYLYRM